MKKGLSILLIIALVSTMLIGCSANNKPASQKSEEEIKAEIKAEMEAEAKKKEELKAEVKAELEAEKKAEEENKQQESQPVSKESEAPKEEVKSQPVQPEKAADVLIKSYQEQGSTTYYQYKANAAVYFDIDGDGKEEEIKYDTVNGKLSIKGYEAIGIDTMFAEKDYFIIVKFSDKFDNKMNMIGIIDYGPSGDIITGLYSIIQPTGKKSFVSVGSVPGALVPQSQYDNTNMEDFNYKAVLKMGQGIEAPVRLSILPNHTWFGRNVFTYYTTYCSLIDNIEKYNLDYKTRSELQVEKDVKAYSEKDLNSESVIIRAGETAYLVATDNKEWISIGLEGGVAGWVNVKDVTESNFSGFAVFD